MSRFESMAEHPAGKGIPESAEVAQVRQDDEALSLANGYSRLDEWHHDWSRRARWSDWVAPVLGVVGLFVLVMVASVAGEIAGGWPA